MTRDEIIHQRRVRVLEHAAETPKLLGIGRSTAYELVHTGDIPSLRLGRQLAGHARERGDRHQ